MVGNVPLFLLKEILPAVLLLLVELFWILIELASFRYVVSS